VIVNQHVRQYSELQSILNTISLNQAQEIAIMALIVKERGSNQVIASGTEDQTVRIFEGNWYFAPAAVNMQNLKVTERTYTCPYKGMCFWIDLEAADGTKTQNVGWVYNHPKPGYEFIKDQIAFYARPTAGTLPEKTAETAV
jgi:uncharacterized protein (DUF427 family)